MKRSYRIAQGHTAYMWEKKRTQFCCLLPQLMHHCFSVIRSVCQAWYRDVCEKDERYIKHRYFCLALIYVSSTELH
jgi:hypothetical protein